MKWLPEWLTIYLENWHLFMDGTIASLIVGACLPLFGGLIFLRRSVFLGVAVPQFSAAGMALGLFLLPWIPALWQDFLDHGHPPISYLFAFAGLGALVALALFSWLQSRSHEGSADGRLAAGFALASALVILFINNSPMSHNLMHSTLEGEILQLDHHGLGVLALAFAVSMTILIYFRRPFLLVAFDAEQAHCLGLPVARLERLQWLCIGIAIGAGVITVGPLLVFGLIFLPPLGARGVSKNMRGFMFHLMLIGLLSTALTWPLFIGLDQPYGPTSVVVTAVLSGVYGFVGRLLKLRHA